VTIATPASPSLLDDGLTAFAPTGGGVQTGYGEVAGAAADFDTGTPVAAWNGVAVLNVTAIANAGATQTYVLALDLSNDPAFGIYVTPASANPLAVGQRVLPVFNVYDQVAYRYIRLRKILSGTAPSITVQAFVLPLAALASLTQGELTQLLAVYAGDWQAAVSNFQAWMSGSASGGPNSNGQYPLSDGAGGTVLADCPAALAAIANGANSVGLFTALGSTTVPAGVNIISTTGYHTVGVGAASYVDTTGTTLPSSGKGVWWTSTANGRQFSLSLEERASPAKFGAPLDGVNDDAVAWNAAFAWILFKGDKGVVYGEGRRYTCFSQVLPDPTRTGISGESCIFDFSGAAYFANPAVSPELCPDPTFQNGSLWTEGNLGAPNRTEWVIGGGVASHPNSQTNQSYGDIGILIAVVANGRYQMSMTVETLQYSQSPGQSAQDYVSCGMQAGALPGYGAGDSANYTIYGPVSTPTTFTWFTNAPAQATDGKVWLQFKSSNTCQITSVSCKFVPDNACIKFSATDGVSTHYEHQAIDYADFMIVGAGYAQGLVFDTPSTADDVSNKVYCHNVYIENCHYGVNIINHAFVMGFYGVGIVGASTCVYMGTGAQDSGEDIAFYSCAFFNSGICVENYGGLTAEMYFHSCSFDYSGLMVLGSGVNNFIACHFEFDQPSGVAPFQNNGGMWYFSGGQILCSGDSSGVMSALFSTANVGDAITLQGVWGYNWAATSNGVMQGPGRIGVSDLQIPSSAQMPDALCFADRYNRLGPSGRFASGITAPIYLQPNSNNGYTTTTSDRNHAAITAGSGGTATLAADSALPIASPLGTTTGLKVTRTGLFGTAGVATGIWVATPARPGKKHTITANVIFPESGEITPNVGATAEVYFEASYRSSFYTDSVGRPVFNELAYGFGESKPVLTTQSGTSAAGLSVAQTAYTKVYFTDVSHWDSANADEPQDFNGCCPDDCNYAVFFINDSNVPNVDWYLTDLCVWEW